jgi:hypothetical protein
VMSPPRTQPLTSGRGSAAAGRQGDGRRRGETQLAAPIAAVQHAGSASGRPHPGKPALDVTDGSPPPTPMGGGRSSTSRRRDLRPPQLSHEGQQAETSLRVVDHRGASRQIFSVSISIASSPRIAWQPASCLNDVCGAGDFDTLRKTASSQGTWALGARAMQEPWVVNRSALFVAPVTPSPLGRQTMMVCKTLVGSSRATPFLPPAVTSAKGGGGAKDGGITGGRQGRTDSTGLHFDCC